MEVKTEAKTEARKQNPQEPARVAAQKPVQEPPRKLAQVVARDPVQKSFQELAQEPVQGPTRGSSYGELIADKIVSICKPDPNCLLGNPSKELRRQQKEQLNDPYHEAKCLLSYEKGLAQAFYESGLFTDIRNPAQALLKIMAGREIGLMPMQSMNSIYIFHGKLGFEVKIFLSKLKKSNKYNYKVVVSDSKICTLKFFENERELGEVSYSWDNVVLEGNFRKESYQKYPKTMIFYRCFSLGLKMYAPDILDSRDVAEELKDYAPVDAKKTLSADLEKGEVKEMQESVEA
ncbi:MAG: hypothetical protein LBU55_01310 [Elusimicrobiota bacterium]|jgi:hypothetical protein|nr:hypothetical protein [Elusimicrobiota bacterium]